MEHYLDVSMLEPCEPMEKTLAAIEKLPQGDYLKVIHRREPHLIYPMLEKAGFAWLTEPGGPSEFQIYIWHRDDQVAKAAVASRSI
ncbi:MAG: DUF2249 domain-containing protein [Gammaproteobacteria bacterium]|nr:DUF2249 domain-containing protein [Gammaproteobacteria bacterium]